MVDPVAMQRVLIALVEGKISDQTFEEWNRETGRKKLPERVGAKTSATRKAKPPRRSRAAKKP